ncbi:MAG: DNA-3-methyladenine glycosylase [Patescibacteria group bacterium]
MRKVLGRKFFDRDAKKIARELLGKYLVRRHHSLIRENKRIMKRGRNDAFMITETEAYDGPRDKASHASRGKTKRNAPMFGLPGRWYVYLCYGTYEMLNIVIGKGGYPAAILIRGAGSHKGPGKLTKALRIDREFNNKIADKKTGLWIEDRGVKIFPKDIIRTPRVGVHYAKEWAGKPYRFLIKNKIQPLVMKGTKAKP